jgi:5-(carboxyamino)imidazole ribonucleotide mutase
MPGGVPVATVAINNAKNAGILAASILANKYDDVREKLIAYKKDMQEEVEGKAAKVEDLGYSEYLKQM